MRNHTTTNPPVDDDLQKAIDNITNTTNTDPVFADPVAVPPMPEAGVMDPEDPMSAIPTPPMPEPMDTEAPIAGNVDPESLVPTPPAPEPIAPLNAMEGVNLTPNANIPAPEPTEPAEPISTEPIPEPMPAPKVETSRPAPAPIAIRTPEPTSKSESFSMNQIKQSALRDLAPLLDHLDMTPLQRFDLYRNIFENLRDYTILARAYSAARAIENETERAEALLYLVETIDKL